jgi:LysM repeat protein
LSTTITKRLVGVLAAVALALGISAATAGPADAAGSVWDKVARCESGGNWHINTGNGFYGGLQFSSSTWRAYGGGKYASRANKASKAEQIAIARRVLASQGPGAWPSCGRRAHLTKANGHANRHATPGSNASGSSSHKKTHKAKSPHKTKSHPKATAASVRTGKSITVRHGDTLAKLAKRYHVAGGWKGLWHLNKSTLKNPNRLKVGQHLIVAK